MSLGKNSSKRTDFEAANAVAIWWRNQSACMEGMTTIQQTSTMAVHLSHRSQRGHFRGFLGAISTILPYHRGRLPCKTLLRLDLTLALLVQMFAEDPILK